MKKALYSFLALCFLCTLQAQAQIQGSGSVVCRGTSITLNANPTQLFTSYDWDFDSSNLNGIISQSHVFSNPCGDGPGGVYLWMNTSSSYQMRVLETPSLQMNGNGDIIVEFWMRYGRVASSGSCEDPDAPDEGVRLQFMNTTTGAWQDFPGNNVSPVGTNLTVGPYTQATTVPGSGGFWPPLSSATAQSTSTLYYWHQYRCTLPAQYASDSLRIRWAQLASSYTGYDAWGLDGISIHAQFQPNQFRWYDDNGNIIGTNNTLQFTPNQSQWVYLNIADTNSSLSTWDSTYITVASIPYVNLGGPDTICKTEHKVMDAGYGFASYYWFNGDTNQTYVAMYPNLPVGDNYIYVSVTDQNGCSNIDTMVLTIEDCTSIKDLEKQVQCLVYPNPASNKINLEVEGIANGSYTLQWIAQNGAVVKEEMLVVEGQKIQQEYAVGHLAKGLYQLQLKGKERNIYLGKMVLKGQ